MRKNNFHIFSRKQERNAANIKTSNSNSYQSAAKSRKQLKYQQPSTTSNTKTNEACKHRPIRTEQPNDSSKREKLRLHDDIEQLRAERRRRIRELDRLVGDIDRLKSESAYARRSRDYWAIEARQQYEQAVFNKRQVEEIERKKQSLLEDPSQLESTRVEETGNHLGSLGSGDFVERKEQTKRIIKIDMRIGNDKSFGSLVSL